MIYFAYLSILKQKSFALASLSIVVLFGDFLIVFIEVFVFGFWIDSISVKKPSQEFLARRWLLYDFFLVFVHYLVVSFVMGLICFVVSIAYRFHVI